MTPTLLSVRYRLSDAARFRQEMGHAAPAIAAVPGLAWKIWGLDADGGIGLGAYLFETVDAADAFARGPALAALRARADVTGLVLDLAPVDAGLSRATGAGPALAGVERRGG
jgi:hypothetical protein